MRKYTLEVILNTSNNTMGCSEQTKMFDIIATDVNILESVTYQFVNENDTIACFPIVNTLIVDIETL